MAQHEPAIDTWHPVGADAFEERGGVGRCDLEFREAGEVHQSDPLAHRQALVADVVPPIAVLEGKLLAFPGRIVPARAFPTKDLAKLRAAGFQREMQ